MALQKVGLCRQREGGSMLYIEDNKLVLREENVAIPDHFATVLHGRAEKM